MHHQPSQQEACAQNQPQSKKVLLVLSTNTPVHPVCAVPFVLRDIELDEPRIIQGQKHSAL